MSYSSGRHFLQIPGPTNVPERVLRAIQQPTIDHRGPAFADMTHEIINGLKEVFQTSGSMIIYPSSGTGALEASLVNVLSPGDHVLMAETGHFSVRWAESARKIGLAVSLIPGDWRNPADPLAIATRLSEDQNRSIKAVAIVHNDTSTGITSDIAAIRQAMDSVDHSALLIVDTISSLVSIDYRHDEWGVDVTVCCSQKGLMLPPGLGFNAVGKKALTASQSAGMHRSYWDWQRALDTIKDGFFPYTPSTNLLFGLREALNMLREEGLDIVFSRHKRLAEAARAAIKGWGLELVCEDPAACSNSLSAVVMPEGHDADGFRRLTLERYNLSLGTGLGRLKGKVFRIGHLGDFNELMLMGTLCGVEMGLAAAGVPHKGHGVAAAMRFLTS